MYICTWIYGLAARAVDSFSRLIAESAFCKMETTKGTWIREFSRNGLLARFSEACKFKRAELAQRYLNRTNTCGLEFVPLHLLTEFEWLVVQISKAHSILRLWSYDSKVVVLRPWGWAVASLRLAAKSSSRNRSAGLAARGPMRLRGLQLVFKIVNFTLCHSCKNVILFEWFVCTNCLKYH